LLIEIAGFLQLIADGHVPSTTHAADEAKQLLEKIGSMLLELDR
jgi:hypothetical protein